MCGSDICLGIIAIFFPPIAVWVKRGLCSADSFINIALCMLGFLPGLFHAWYIIAATPSPTYDELAQNDPERGQVTYYYVSSQPQPRQQVGRGGAPIKPVGAAPARSYGTVPNQQFPPQQSHVQPHPAQYQAPASSSAAAGPSDDAAPPPSYAQVVEGDHKVQKK